MLRNRLNKLRVLWWGLGVSCGLAMSGFWSTAPLHATATDRQETFAMSTGMLEGGFEAIYTLDFLTGDLRGAVPAFNNPRAFSALYAHNVMQDLGVDIGKNPKFMIVTGTATLRSGGLVPVWWLRYLCGRGHFGQAGHVCRGLLAGDDDSRLQQRADGFHAAKRRVDSHHRDPP